MTNSEKIPIAIILGGTNPHKELIRNLKSRGFYTVLIDYYENPPAKEEADEHVQESTLDKEKVLEIATEKKADLVIATCIDQANVTACFVAEKLNLPIPYTYEVALTASNKVEMKRMMKSAKIPTADFFIVNDFNDMARGNLNFPLVVKPADTTGSKGVQKIYEKIELESAIKDAMILSRINSAVVEEFIEGEEIQFDCFVQNGEVTVLMSSKKNKMSRANGSVLQSFGSLIPARVNKSILKKVQDISKRIVDTFNFDNTPFFIQTIVNEYDINVIEFAPRIGGGLSYRIIKHFTSFDTLDTAVNFYLGEYSEITSKKSKSVFCTNNIYTESGVYGSVEGVGDLIDKQIVLEYFSYKTKGMLIGGELTSNNRVGAFIIEADNDDERRKKMQYAYQNIRVLDGSNNTLKLRGCEYII